MIRKCAVGFASFGLAAALCGEVVTKKYDWKPVNGIQEVNVVAGKVVLSQLEFDLGEKMITPLKASTAHANARVDNNGFISQEVGVALAVFDAEENLIAAGNGGVKLGYLSGGSRENFTIHFYYVYRNLEKAARFTVSLETREKPAKPTPRPTAPPAPTPVK